jgi:hypothetical protein
MLQRRAEFLRLNRLSGGAVLEVLGDGAGAVGVLDLATPHIVELADTGGDSWECHEGSSGSGIVGKRTDEGGRRHEVEFGEGGGKGRGELECIKGEGDGEELKNKDTLA